jgi:hypothetical protein
LTDKQHGHVVGKSCHELEWEHEQEAEDVNNPATIEFRNRGEENGTPAHAKQK